MKNPFRFLLATLALLGASLGLQAEVAVKIVTIDMEQLFEKYYKTEIQQTKLREDEKKAREQIDAMKKDGESLVTEANALQEQTKNAILSDEARKKAQTDLEAKVAEIRAKEGEIQRFMQQLQQSFQKRLAQFQQQAAEEIAKVATEIGKKHGATLVLNQGASAIVIYADPGFSITDEVLEAINKDRPPAISVTPPASEPAK